LSIERLQELEEEDDKQNAESEKKVPGHAKTQEPQPPNSDYVEVDIPSAQSLIEGPAIIGRVYQERASEWLSDVASDHVISRPASAASMVSDIRQQSLVLAGKWTTDGGSAIETDNVAARSNSSHIMRRNIKLEATVAEEQRARAKAINEKLISEKLLAEMRQELQRLRVSSERKFQRWHLEKRAEQERTQELRNTLKATIAEEQRERTKAISDKLISEKLLAEMRQELHIAKEQARGASVQLGEEQRMKSEAIANAVVHESEKLIMDGQKLLEGRYTHGPTWVLAPGTSTYLKTLPKFKYLPEQFLVGYLGTCT
jgi:hypothetical protein